MFFIEGGDKYLLLQLTVLQVVIKARCAGYPDKNGAFSRPCDERPIFSKHRHQIDLFLEWR